MPPVCSYDISSIAKKSDYSTTKQNGRACISGFLLTIAFHVCGGISAIYLLYIKSRWCANSHYSTYICGNSKRVDTWSADRPCELHWIDDYILPHWSVRWNMKVKGFVQGCSGVSPVSLSSELHRVFLEIFFFSVRVCQKSSLSFFCHSPDCHSIEGESGSLSHALVLFLLPHMVGSKSSRLQNEHLWQRLMCVQWGKEQSRENTQQQIHYSPLDKPLSSLCFCLAHILVYSEVMEVGTMFLWIIVLPHHITDLIGSERPSLSPLPSIPLCAMNIELTIEI